YLSFLEEYPNYYVEVAVYEAYRNTKPKKLKSFHKYQRSINKKIWLGNILIENDDTKVFGFYEYRIKVFKDTIVSVNVMDHVNIA
ncbi:hypothetical protein R0J90_19020, partial [Micrococcus sp. SIMBA_144]